MGRIPRPVLRNGRPRASISPAIPWPSTRTGCASSSPTLIGELDDGTGLRQGRPSGRHHRPLKPLKTKKDERMATFVLEDLTGKIEVVAFPECFGKYGQYLREGQLVWIKGKYMGEEENRRISLSQAMPLAEAFEKQAKRVVVRIFLPGLEEATLGRAQGDPRRLRGQVPRRLRARDAPLLPARGPERRGPEGHAVGGPAQEDRSPARRELRVRGLLRPSAN